MKNSEELSGKIFGLPNHYKLTKQNLDYIIKTIDKLFEKNNISPFINDENKTIHPIIVEVNRLYIFIKLPKSGFIICIMKILLQSTM